MGLLSNTILTASEALNPIKAGLKQASSYSRPAAKLGMRAAKQVTRDAMGHGLSYYAAGGAALGAAAGGYNAYENRQSIVGGALKGGAIGGAGGAALRMGMSAYGMRGGTTARGIGAGIGRGRQAVSNSYRSQMLMSRMERAAGVTRGPAASFAAGKGFVMGKARSAMGSNWAGTAAGYAGRAVGAARGGATWAKGMAGSAYSKYSDMGRYYAGL